MKPNRRVDWIKALRAACLVAGLTACAEIVPVEDSAEPETVAEPEPPTAPSVVVEDEPDTRLAVIPARKPLPPPLDAEALIGSNEAEVTQALGAPIDTRTEAPATIWSYGDGDCGLDLYYFLDVSGNTLRVLSYRVRTVEDSDATRRHCLRQLNQRT